MLSSLKVFRLSSLFMVTMFYGCTNLAPFYNQPNTDIDKRFTPDNPSSKQNFNTIDLSQTHWRSYFLDPQLQALILKALHHNHDLNIAALNIVIANEQYGISQSNRLPKPNAKLSYQRNQASTKFTNSQYQANLGLEGFEIDFFSRVKNLSKIALNQYLQTIEAQNSAKISIISAVAKTYYQIQAANQQIKALKQQQNHYEKALSIYKSLSQQGIANTNAFSNAIVQISTTKIAIAQQQLNIKQSTNALSTLLGSSPSQLTIKPSFNVKGFPDQSIFINLPSKVLFNRPDIKQAEHQLRIEQANIGVARAALFPSIKLSNQLGYSNSSLDSIIDSSNWTLGINVDIPIFDLSHRKKNVQIAKLNQQVAIQNYQKTIRSAFQEVSDILATRTFIAKQKTLSAQQIKQAQIIVKTAQNAFSLDQASVEEFISSQQGLLSLKQQVIRDNLTFHHNQIDLFMVLGGKL